MPVNEIYDWNGILERGWDANAENMRIFDILSPAFSFSLAISLSFFRTIDKKALKYVGCRSNDGYDDVDLCV